MYAFDTLLLPLLPLAVGGVCLLLIPAPLPQHARRQSTVTLAAILLFTFLTSLLIIRLNTHSDSLTASRLIASSLAMLAAALTAAPLIDCTRKAGLLLGASLAAIFMLPLLLHGFVPLLPEIGGAAVLYAILLAASSIGLLGSRLLPQNPTRILLSGGRRLYPVHQGRLASGWFGFGVLLLAFADLMQASDTPLSLFPVLLAGSLSVLITLLHTSRTPVLPKAGESFAAAVLCTLLATPSLEVAVLLAIAVNCMTVYSETLIQTLKLDDPHHLMGTVLLPASLGLLLPGIAGAASFAACAVWLFGALFIGLVFSLIVWTLVKLTVGFAAAAE